ncbi:glycosyl transferase [Actinoplanes sp. N902-109]|uniref:glycosyl transferase n=1 Tax=Actinoplanes sp. (strain N902-109) TaxID=649831 RepID=UPI0012F958C0|nr:glycosyl transferase [Actinoplanes sp. N902-109]
MPVLVALVVGLAVQPVLVRALTAAAVLDVPCARSSHTTPVPRGGGVAVVLAAAAGFVLLPSARMLLVPVLAFAAIGLAEDVRGVAVPVRLALHLLAGTISAVTLLPLPLAGVLAVALWLTAYANAFNFMDGINGISAAQAVVAGLVFALAGLPAGLVLAAAAATFLPWNAGRARIFLGDAGSYGLGALIAALAVLGLRQGLPVAVVLAPLAVTLADTGCTLARRILRGEPWYRPHRSHTYQRLTDAGWTHQQVTLLTVAISAGLSAAAAVDTRLAVAVAVLLLGGYFTLPAMVPVR